METKQISVLLTRLDGRFSDFIYLCTGRRYTHASIRLDEMGDYYCSFNYRGLCTEKPKFFARRKIRRSVLFQVSVPAAVHDELKEYLETCLADRDRYHYSKLGVFLCVMRIPHRFQDTFFCSQFVAELLMKANLIEWKRSTSVCTPNHLETALRRCANLRSIISNPVLA